MLDGKVQESLYPVSYHITPMEGLLNDPNGLCYFKGRYHVFYQLNPKGTSHMNKCWGHVSSTDLINWRREKIALKPSEWYDKDGIYSGSALVWKNKLYVFYTGNVRESEEVSQSYQCMAVSTDGYHFEKMGPIIGEIAGYTRHVRDPKVWYEEQTEQWHLILGAQKNNQLGTILEYTSSNLFEWEFQGELFSDTTLEQLEQRGYMWECPDLFYLNGEWVLIYSPQGIVEDGTRFHNIHQTVWNKVNKKKKDNELTSFQLAEMDWGFEFYAPQTFETPDKRRILLAWQGAMPPEMEQSVPTVKEGWVHQLTLPRELSLIDGKLIQQPIRELENLRKNLTIYSLQSCFVGQSIENEQEIIFSFDELSGSFEISIKETTKIYYDHNTQELSLERKNWLNQKIERRKMRVSEGIYELRIFLDGSSLELFINEGQSVATARFFEEGEMSIAYKGINFGKAYGYELVSNECNHSHEESV